VKVNSVMKMLEFPPTRLTFIHLSILLDIKQFYQYYSV
jgi:hypothetical protein